MKNLLYSRCITACSAPPVYCRTGIQSAAVSVSNGPPSNWGVQYRSMYQDESMKVSMVSVSRRPGPPHFGHTVFTNSSLMARGRLSRGPEPYSASSGSSTGNSDSGTGCTPHSSQ